MFPEPAPPLLPPPPPEPPFKPAPPPPPPPPPPAEVIVVKPEPEIEEFEPVLPSEESVTEAPPSPTVTVITIPPDTV